MMKEKRLWLIVPFLIFCGVFAVYYMNYKQSRDTQAPVIECETDSITASINVTDEELLEGVTATDNIDGDLTSKIMIEEITKFSAGVRTVRYAVVDSSNNIGRFSRELVYTDYKSPEFALTQPLIFDVREEFNLLDVITASDVLDGDITYKVRLTSDKIEYQTPGIYEVSYGVSNSAGDYVSLVTTVELREKESREPVITLTQPLVYLDKGTAFSAMNYVESVFDPNLNYGIREGENMKEDYDIGNVKVTGSVDTGVPGVYEVTFTAVSDNPEYIGMTRMIVIVNED